MTRVDTNLLNLKYALVEMMSYSNKLRRPWTPQQDEALLFLRDELKVAKWPQIAKRMVEKFKLGGRTEKQCRDRYVNFLRNADDSYIWKLEDQNRLMELYYKLGNKWSEIATYFPNTNGIFIKNKFYSRLRKAIRYLNTIIQSYFYETQSKFSFDIIFKLVNISNKKSRIIENIQIKELLDSNPKVFQGNFIFTPDIIVKIISMTDCNTKYNLKKKKIQRISPKDQFKWKKLIEVLRYLENKDSQKECLEFIQKDFHLQTNHNEGLKSLSSLGIKNLLCFAQNSEENRFQQNSYLTQNSIEAGYIQLRESQELMFKRIKPIIIISDLKRSHINGHKISNLNHKNLSIKKKILSTNKVKSTFRIMAIQDDKSLSNLSKDEFIQLPMKKYVIAQP